VERWGRDFGIGMGRVPVSEALINNYRVKPVRGRDGRYHLPVATCKSQIDYCEVPDEEYYGNLAITRAEDPDYAIRADIMRDKALLKPGSPLAQYHPEEAAGAQARLDARRAARIAKFMPEKQSKTAATAAKNN
jgi:hypothetical protein